MISGTISGRLMTMKAAGMPSHGLTLVVPIAASVADMVDKIVADTAIVSVFPAALWNCSFVIAVRYQWPLIPSNRLIALPELNEKTMRSSIGA